ncbi:MAG TPA: DUF1326 domain-containing protein [Candidatus Acidoferrum sp.]|jgi:hypothetical protein|nr:DUF1326 domain-containing protein [Candidatus Acidoferrum sp.]
MKTVALLLTGFACFLGRGVLATEQPRGTLLELHSCELYAGGCIVSSEATLGGRHMVRAWNFTGGKFNGADLAGLQLAVLQSSPENLAVPQADPGQAVVYLPQAATAVQREALLGWLKASQPDLKAARLQTRTVSIYFSATGAGCLFSAGKFLSVKTAARETCETGACGEALWYSPRSETSVFTVAVDQASQVTEPLLKLKWNDAGRRSVFLAKFGENTNAKDLYVSTADLCGPTGKLF